jgi:PKHD-type hydroxylase
MNSSQFFMNSLHRNQTNHCNYYYFVNQFSDNEINEIKYLASTLVRQDAVTGENTVSNYRKSEVSWIDESEDSGWIYDKIAKLAHEANKEMWNFDIWGYHDNLQYTTYYGDGGHYDWHLDLGPGLSNRKLSVVLQLSDPEEYVGGDLQMNVGGSLLTVPKSKGLLCFFPSFLLHRVTPLSSGTRTSLVTWLCGANLR